MSGEIQEFLKTVDALVKNLSPAERRVMLRNLSAELRRRNAARVKENTQPDGSRMAARQGDRWKMMGLKAGRSLKSGQKFNFFKERGLSLEFIRTDDGRKIVGRENGLGNPGYEASGFLREHIYLKGSTGKKLKMYQKLANQKYLRSKNTADSAVIGFLGGLTAKIAAEHHYGDSKKNLPSRELIGLSADDIAYVQNEIIRVISKGIN